MKNTNSCVDPGTLRALCRFEWMRAAAAVFGSLLFSNSHADSTLMASASNTGPLTATVHLSFRVTVLPSLALSNRGEAIRVQGNSGTLTLQRSELDASDGSAPVGSVQLVPQRRVVDAALRTSSFEGGKLVTIASP
jgi:hypothetical protein